MFSRVLPLLIGFFLFSCQWLWARTEYLPEDEPAKTRRPAAISYKRPFVQDGVSIQLKELKLILTNAPEADMQSASGVPAAVLALKYKLVNNNKTKKLDIGDPLGFILMDEFGNHYTRTAVPVEYPGPIHIYGANYPSLYPGESMEETVFFEPPIAGSRTLYLTIDASSAGMDKEFTLKIPAYDIDGIEQIAIKVPAEEKVLKAPVVGPIRIIFPPNGSQVRPGEFVQIRVEVPPGSRRPDNVYVVVPAYVLEDERNEFNYELNIPESARGTMAVTVIGKWKTETGQEVLSDSIVLKIIEP